MATYVINDDCTSLTGWARSSVGAGTSVEVANGLHFTAGPSAPSAIAILKNTTTGFPTKFSVTLTTKFITLGTFAHQDFYIFSMFGTLASTVPKRFAMIFSSDKLTLGMYSDANVPVFFYFDAPAMNVDATWIFAFDRSAGDDATTVEVFLNGVSQGTETFNSLSLFASEYPLVSHVLYGATTPSTECYIKELRISDVENTNDMKLQFGLTVEDTNGNQYTYGFIDTGYMERLEYGNTFDGNSIVSTFQFGDFAPLGLSFATQLDHLKLISVIPTTATDDVTCTHYADTATAGTDYTMDVSTTGYRLSKPAFDSKLQSEVYHSLKFTKTTDDEVSGFKPISVVATFHQLAED